MAPSRAHPQILGNMPKSQNNNLNDKTWAIFLNNYDENSTTCSIFFEQVSSSTEIKVY